METKLNDNCILCMRMIIPNIPAKMAMIVDCVALERRGDVGVRYLTMNVQLKSGAWNRTPKSATSNVVALFEKICLAFDELLYNVLWEWSGSFYENRDNTTSHGCCCEMEQFYASIIALKAFGLGYNRCNLQIWITQRSRNQAIETDARRSGAFHIERSCSSTMLVAPRRMRASNYMFIYFPLKTFPPYLQKHRTRLQ